MKVKGVVTRIFAEKDNGFKILVINVHDMREIPVNKRNPEYPGNITLVGMMRGVEMDYVIEANGEFESRPNGTYWPWQFKVSDYTICELETPKLMRKFLRELPGVSDELAKRMLTHFPNIADVIENHPNRLMEINGITKEKAFQIRKAFLELREKKSLQTFLQQFGFKQESVKNISAQYGVDALKKIKENPYILCDDKIASFRTCDKIAKELNFAADNNYRLSSAMNYVLNVKAASKGNTYLTEDILVVETNAFFRDNAVIESAFSEELLEDRLNNLVAEGLIIYDNGRFYHPERYRNELDVARILLRRTNKGSKTVFNDDLIKECLAVSEEEIGFSLDEVQKQAVITALKNSTSVITGGPGSGKTSILRAFIRTRELLSKALGISEPIISLAAPTGMAAKRMSGSTGKEAKTIHKLFDIKYDMPTENDVIEPLVSDIVVLDEVSMLDIDIMAHILRSLDDNTSLLLVGDVDQIPSIGPGNVLADIINSDRIPVTRLVRSYRHGSRKTILSNAIKINTGQEDLETNRSDFVLHKVEDRPTDKECRRVQLEVERIFCEEFLANGKDLYSVQVISPLRSKTLASVDELNTVLQKIANPEVSPNEQITSNNVVFRKGDKVMQISNNYDKGVYNGDVGIIKVVSVAKNKILVDFQGKEVEYLSKEFDQLKHAFAVTVHKSQGSEYSVVIMVITNFHSMMLLRNLFYTGVTRAKQRLILVGDEDAVKYAIRNTKGAKRLSALCDRLKEQA